MIDDYSIKLNVSGTLPDAMRSVNLPWPDDTDPPFDGEFHPFTDPESSSKPLKNTAAWFRGEMLPDGTKIATFGSFRRPDAGPWHWCSVAELTAEQRAALEQMKVDAAADRQRRQADAALTAQRLWDAATPVKESDHPYLSRKQVHGLDALRVSADGVLLVPLRDASGKLHSLNRIWPDGTKRLLPDGDARGHFCTLGPKPTKAIYLAEGIATGLTVCRAVSTATVSCGDASNLKPVAEALRLAFPAVELIIAADADPAGIDGATAATLVVANSRMIVPQFAAQDTGNDWNDLQQIEGLAVVTQQLTAPPIVPDWPIPSPLPGDLPPVVPFNLALLPDAFQPWIADIAERMQCPPDFPAIGAMTALAAVVGRKIGIRPKRQDDWLVVPNVWGLVVGRPGVLKSPALQESKKPLARLEAEAGAAYNLLKIQAEAEQEVLEQKRQVNKAKIRELLKQGGADSAELAALVISSEDTGPVRKRYIVNDTSIEKLGELLNENPNGLMAFRDELLGLLYNLERAGQEGAKQFYLEAWNGNGRFVYDRIGRGTVEIDACCLSILGSIQPEPLQTYLMTAPDDGLMQRFQLAVWPDSTRDWRNVDRWPDKTAKDAVWDVFKRLDDLVPFAIGATPVDEGDVPCLRFSEEAQLEFDQWRASLEKRLRTEELTPAIETTLAKYRSLVPSLALLIHCVDAPEGGPVGLTALIKACAWTEYLESHAHRIYSAKLVPAILSGRALAAKIKAGKLADRFTLREVYRPGWARLTTGEQAQAAINLLIELDWLRAINEPGAAVGGRPKTVYQINPQILEAAP